MKFFLFFGPLCFMTGAIASVSGASLYHGNFSTIEYDALYDLFVSCGGSDWLWSPALGTPWVFTSTANPCNSKWQGLICNTESTSTISISLQEMNLNGSIPDSIGNFTNLEYLNLYNNYVFGTIPSAASQLSDLVLLDLSENFLSGHIPPLSHLLNLQFLFLYENALSGTIPASIGELSDLRQLDVSDNELIGPIPDSLGNLFHLEVLYLYDNRLNGPIPSSLGGLSSLQELHLENNQLSGPMPQSLMNLSALSSLVLADNRINGTLPENIGNLTNLEILYLPYTDISGTLPQSIGQLSLLNNMNFQECHLSGTLPNTLGNLSALQVFELSQNFFSGTVPQSVANLTLLIQLSAAMNHITGTVPDVARMHSLRVYWLFENSLTGSIPSQAGALPLSLISFELFQNLMTGSFPEQVGNLSQLFEFNMFDNYFSGTLPASMGQMHSLQYIEVYDNLLSGCIPPSFASLSMLTTLLLENNRLSGEIGEVFNSTAQKNLFTIEVGGNSLRGSLPREIFSLPRLNAFSAVGNCFKGSLPDNICTASTLTVLLLDGASSGCRKRVLPGVPGWRVPVHAMQGTIPPCLLQMPLLQILHMSSNGFTGSLPADMAVGPALRDLSLDHNRLTGKIPVAFQSRVWGSLDMSFNKLTGTLEKSFATQFGNSSVSLNNNRLSGEIPESMLDLLQVNVLAGNKFTCEITSGKSELPQHDNERGHYQCGSNAFDIPYYLWLALAVSCVVAAVVTTKYGEKLSTSASPAFQTLLAKLRAWRAVWHDRAAGEMKDDIPRVKRVLQIHSIVGTASLALAGFIVCVLLPVYLILGVYYFTHTHEYAYAASAAFLSGTTAGAVEFALFSLLAVLFCVGFLLGTKRYQDAAPVLTIATTVRDKEAGTISPSDSADIDANTVATSVLTQMRQARNSKFAERTMVWGIFISLNLVVVVGANIGFLVATTDSSIPSSVLTFLQIMLAVFKLTWKWFCGYLIRWTSLYCSSSSPSSSPTESLSPLRGGPIGTEFVSLQVFITLVNNIAIPCLVAAVVSPNCFYNYFHKAPEIKVTIEYPFCIVFQNSICTEYTPFTTTVTYQPPFTYSYQCSSSVLAYYAPSFLISCLLVTFVLPLTHAALLYLHSMAADSSPWQKLLSSRLPRMLRSLNAAGAEFLRPDAFKLYFDAQQFMIAQLSQLGILLTFGVVFPPLGVAVAFVLVFVPRYIQGIIARFVCLAREKNLSRYIAVLEDECTQAGAMVQMLQSSMWMLLSFNCCFCAFFVFDILGDKVGFNGALWVLIVLPLLPLILYNAVKVVFPREKREDRKKSDSRAGIELTDTVLSPIAIDVL